MRTQAANEAGGSTVQRAALSNTGSGGYLTVRQEYIPLDCPSEWKKAFQGIKHSFGHTWENCYAMQLTTGFKTYLYCFESDNVRIVCPIAEREYGGYIDIIKPSGFSGFVGSGSYPGFSRYWKEFAGQQGYVCGYLGLNPIFDYSAHFEPDETYHYIHDQCDVYVLDLTPTEDELFANLSTNRKRQLKSWDRIASDFIFDKSILTDFFLDNYLEFYTSKNALGTYYFSRESFSYLLSLDNVFMVGARNGGQVVAVSVFAYTPDEGEYLFNVSLPEGQHYAASLIWYGVKRLKSLQIPLLNLGGGWDSLAEFKRRFGAHKFSLKVLKQVYNHEIYQKLCRQAKVNPDDMTGYFPAYRRK
jgi:hypothetical protein